MMSSLIYMIILVLLWWIANGITSISSKSMMMMADHGNKPSNNNNSTFTSITSAFEDLRWLELTTLQHLLGAMASVIFLKAVGGKSAPVWPTTDSPKTIIYIAGLANVVGNLATNAAYALVSSGATQVIKSYEPIFTFFLSLCLYKNYGDLTLSTLLSIVTMSAGACTFVVLDKSFNIWGLLAAISSNMGFATRNIFLKKLAWDNPVQKYAVISICSMILLMPAILLKMVLISASTSLLTHAQESIISAVSHFTYNTASITVLQDITPLTHATLNLSKRVFVIIANLVYFNTPVSTMMLMGLFIFFIGLALYSTRNRRSSKEATSLVLFFVIITSIWLHCRHLYHVQRSEHSHRLTQSVSTEIPSELNYNSLQTSSMQLNCGVLSTISMVWVFHRPLTTDLLMNIEHLHSIEPCSQINVYCGTLQCVNAVLNLNNPSITSEFLVINKLVKDTPFEEWFVRHPLYKVLAGKDFETHLQKVVQLAILRKYGGIYVDPRIRLTGTQNQTLTNRSCANGWVSEDIDVVCFPIGHPFIKMLVEKFIKHYPKKVVKKKFHFDFHKVLKHVAVDQRSNGHPDSVTLYYVKRNQNESLFERRHFGALWYDWLERQENWSNLSNEIQSLAGIQFLPFVDNLLERDKLSLLEEKQPVMTFLNAWYGDQFNDWPPPVNLHTILTSIYIQNNSVQRMWTDNIDYLKRNEPIGCQDLSTLQFFKQINVESYYSGCLTLMMSTPSFNRQHSDNIYFVDVNWDIARLFPQEIIENGTTLHHGTGYIVNGFKQFSEAYHLLRTYASAKLVITQRIHCALPCVAMGVPVIFVKSPKMPGGVGSKTQSSPHVEGLTPLFHTVDLYNMSTAEVREWLEIFPWDDPPPNPNPGMMMRMRATFWNVICQNQALNDASRKFGMIPLQPPPVQASVNGADDQLLVHLVFTASTFKWHHWRTLESIVHHHPFAEVTIHSNTLQQSEFSVLTEAGYLVKVKRYSLTQMLKDSPAEEFISKLSDAVTGQHWESHQIDLLRLLLLYKWGGIYMDNDIIIVNPVHSLKNVLTWEDPRNYTISGSFIALERDSGFLRDCLVAFVKHYDANKQTQTVNGADLMTNVWRQWMTKGEIVAMKSPLFYMFSDGDVKTECFAKSSSFDTKMKFLREEAYAVRVSSNVEEMSSKLSDGTICKHILNDFCALCNTQY